MNLPTTTPQFTYTQKNEHVKSFPGIWGGKTEGIKKGDKRHGIILGFTDGVASKLAEKSIVLKCFEEHGAVITVAGCQSLMRQLHVEQNMPFINLIYNVGDVVCVTFDGSFIGDRGKAAGQLIVNYTVNQVNGYTLTDQDRQDIMNYQKEQAARKQVSQLQQIQIPQNYNQQVQHPHPQQQYQAGLPYYQQNINNIPQPPVQYQPPVQFNSQHSQQYQSDVPQFAPPPKPQFTPAKKEEIYDY